MLQIYEFRKKYLLTYRSQKQKVTCCVIPLIIKYPTRYIYKDKTFIIFPGDRWTKEKEVNDSLPGTVYFEMLEIEHSELFTFLVEIQNGPNILENNLVVLKQSEYVLIVQTNNPTPRYKRMKSYFP